MAMGSWRHGIARGFGRKLTCSFCGRAEDRVERLVAGASAHICDECVAKCAAVLEQHGGFVMAAPDNSTNR